MLKKTMTTVDFGGTTRTEDYYFNLTESEIIEMQLSTEGGLAAMAKRITDAKSQLELVALFKTMICKSYGVLSPDGRKFIKNQAVLDDFMATQAYSDLYMELVQDAEKAAEFFNNILPENMRNLTEEKPEKMPAQPGLAVALPQNTAQ
mgnify:CR=1 FL=1